ncbi:hypothetical protein BDV24DRAFT_125888 [Aspergillus arachidicola]|uniref:Uncharacterized protein n=1 Tax=Aspergillus arachidicola TaxID=656916 RepID=A0A5N6YPB7_9EURO|nr:hypothetical protein BDV24DRAFT_125888 [Aspergillus arachidicola]
MSHSTTALFAISAYPFGLCHGLHFLWTYPIMDLRVLCVRAIDISHGQSVSVVASTISCLGQGLVMLYSG